jgi:cap2 methyltransferase
MFEKRVNLTPFVEKVESKHKVGNYNFEMMEQQLFTSKTLFDSIPPDQFQQLMSILDVYTELKKSLKTEYRFKISTNASMKMYELIELMNLLPQRSGEINVFSNAELPGAFISTIISFVGCKRPNCNLDWVASSYLPAAAAGDDGGAGDGGAGASTTLLDDMYGLYKDNQENWLMGGDLSGDLTKYEVIERLAAKVRHKFGAGAGADLYTSDAGIDVSADYNNQEKNTALLNFGQTLCGIMTLKPGGNMLTKQYSFFSVFNRSLIHLLTYLFNELYVVKPLTSRPINSETYIVGKGFNPKRQDIIQVLKDTFARCEVTPVDSWINEVITTSDPEIDEKTADSSLYKISRELFLDMQIPFIRESVDFYLKFNLHSLRKHMHHIKIGAKNRWIAQNSLVLC